MSKIFPFIQLDQIPYQRIALRLGYPSFNKLSQKDKDLIENMVDLCLKEWEPKGITKNDLIIEISDQQIKTKHLLIPGQNISKLLKKSAKVSLLAVSAGAEILKIRELYLNENNNAYAFVLDGVLSELTDELAIEINRYILREANMKGYNLTRRFSPGYGDLPLSFQKNLLNFIEARKIGLSISRNFILKPEKSVTAIIGWEK